MAQKRKTNSKKQGAWSRFKNLPRPVLALLFLVVFGVVGVKLMSLTNATAFQYVGTHPQAITQPETTSGRQLKSLAAWNGKIYAGYGDYNSNTGPVYLTPYDPATNSFAATPEHAADTESIEVWKQIGNKMFALHVDPKSHWGAAYSVSEGSTSSAATTWTNNMPPTMTHVFGIANLSATDIYISGSKDNGSAENEEAKVFRSTDGGATWNESLSIPNRGGYNRMYFVGTVGGQVYAQNYSTSDFAGSNPQVAAWVFNGSSWSKTTALTSSGILSKAGEFNGKMLAMWGGSLVSFDGRSTTTVRSSVKDYKVHSDGYVYALSTVNSQVLVVRSKDLVTWEQITVAPATARSLALLGTTIYVGTSDSELYKAVIDPTVSDTTGPTVSLTNPANAYTVTTSNDFTANATDSSGVTKVEYYVGSSLLGAVIGKASSSTGCFSTGGTVTATCSTSYAPNTYTLRWNGSGITAGSYPLKAVAYDSSGNTKESSTVTITVPSGLYPADTQVPVVKITSPSATQRNIRKSINISASATDNDSVAYMEATLDGALVASSNTATLSKSVALTKGSHTLVIVAKDRAGNVGQSYVNFNSK